MELEPCPGGRFNSGMKFLVFICLIKCSYVFGVILSRTKTLHLEKVICLKVSTCEKVQFISG